MNEFYASGLTNEQLKAEILRQGRKANLRLNQQVLQIHRGVST